MLRLEPLADKLVSKPAFPVNLGTLRLLDVPGRWGRVDAHGRGPIEVERKQGLYPQLGTADPQTPKRMPAGSKG
jgi:hypothetical protein